MSSQQNMFNIPVHYDNRTFEKHRRDLLTNLENKSGSPKSSPVAKRPGEVQMNDTLPFRDDWFDELSEWANASWKQWDDEMRRMRMGMFTLLPLEKFGMESWSEPGKTLDSASLMKRMEQFISDIRGCMGPSEVAKAGSVRDYLKDAYEVTEDGTLRFKVRFDVKGFRPREIKITSTDDCVMVYAKKKVDVEGTKKEREFCRIIGIPQSIDHSKMEAQLTEDGVLMLEAPVKSPDYSSITFNDKRRLGIRPKSEQQTSSTPDKTTDLSVKGKTGPTILENGKKLHVEMPVDPLFRPDDICVNIDLNRIHIQGKRYKKAGDRKHVLAEFRQSYEIPETVDPLSVKAKVINNMLVIEAPMGSLKDKTA